MECFLFPFYVGDLLATLLLRIVSQPSLITLRTREAENLPAPGKGGDRALRGAALRADEGEQRCFSPRLQAQGGALQVSFCIELRCPGVNVCVGTSENGREKTRLTMCTWCTCRWYITGCAVRGSAGMMLSCKRGYMGPMFSVVPPTQV